MRSTKWMLALSVFLLFVAGEFAMIQGRIGMRDFRVNLTAGDRVLHGETPYRTSDEHYQFKYSPFCAVLYAPLAYLPETAAKAVWFGLVFAAVVFILAGSARLAGHPCGECLWPCLAPGLILAKYLFRELELGQINAIMTALFLGTAGLFVPAKASLRAGRQTAAGCLSGLAAAMKPYGLIVLPYLLIKKRWTALAAALAVLAATYLLPAVYFGFAGNAAVHREWIAALSRSTPPLLTTQDNISLLGFLSKWLGPAGPALPAFALLLVLLGALTVAFLAKGVRRERAAILDFAWLLLLIPLVSPLGWDYTFLSSVPAVAVIAAHWPDLPKFGRLFLGADFAVIALSLFDVLGRRLYGSFMAASVLTVCFLGLLPALFYLRWKKEIG